MNRGKLRVTILVVGGLTTSILMVIFNGFFISHGTVHFLFYIYLAIGILGIPYFVWKGVQGWKLAAETDRLKREIEQIQNRMVSYYPRNGK